MEIVQHKTDGVTDAGLYKVVEMTAVGEIVLFGPASLDDCKGYILKIMNELDEALKQIERFKKIEQFEKLRIEHAKKPTPVKSPNGRGD